MFEKPLITNRITPNFLNSLLSNISLYEMFNTDFDNNNEYFQGIPKSEYLYAILEFLCDKLSSSNLYQIYDEEKKEEIISNNTILTSIKNFYKDYLLNEINKDHKLIFFSRFFKCLVYARENDLYARDSQEFIDFYNEVMNTYQTYRKEILEGLSIKMQEDNLTVSDFDLLCHYAKNDIYKTIPIDYVTAMIKNHAYKTNHIFDKEVVMVLIYSIASDYLSRFNINNIIITYEEGIRINKEEKNYDIKTKTIYIDELLLDTFISGNYVELVSELFYKMDLFKDEWLLTYPDISMNTLKVIMKLIASKIDIFKLFQDKKYNPYNYYIDLKATSFLKTLKFYQMLGVDLFSNYITSTIKHIDLKRDINVTSFYKEIANEIVFASRFKSLDEEKRKSILSKYKVISLFYNVNGTRKRGIDIFKESTYKDVIKEYMQTTIPYPEVLIDDIESLSDLISEDTDFLTGLLTYIYTDTFYYSLDGYLKLMKDKDFDVNSYLDELYVRIYNLKDIECIKRFKKYALEHIEEIKKLY